MIFRSKFTGSVTLLTALLIAGCSGDSSDADASAGADSETNHSDSAASNDSDPTADSGESSDSAGGDSDADSTGSGEISAQIIFDGEELALSDMHCAPVAAEDNEMRFLASFDGGEVQIDESGGPDGSAVIRVRQDGESDYTNTAGPHLEFTEAGVQGDIEISNADEETAAVTIDIAC